MYLGIRQAVPSNALRLHLRGYEISEFDYQYVQQQGEDTFLPKVGQRKAKKDVVRADMKLAEYPGVCGCVHVHVQLFCGASTIHYLFVFRWIPCGLLLLSISVPAATQPAR